MTTYLLTKDSTLWAFEGPEEPDGNDFVDQDDLDTKFQQDAYRYACDVWEYEMSTARESALPVVNAEEVGFLIEGSTILLNEEGRSRLKLFARPGETVPLPGWGLEVVLSDGWVPSYNDPDNKWGIPPSEPEAYRLKRSDPVKKEPIKLTFYSGKLWHSDKPFPVKPQTNASILEDKYLLEVRSWLSTAYEVQNPEVIPAFDGLPVSLKPLVDGDELTLPDGYGIDKFGICEGCNRVGLRHCAHADSCGYPKNYVRITIPEKPKKSLRERIAEGECVSERGTDYCPVCIDSCDAAHHKRNIEELIDKPENSAHSFTEGSDCGGDNIIVNPVSIEEHCQGINCPFEYSCKDGCIYPINPVVEPSESQEELLNELSLLILYNTTDKEILGKFTITRK